VLHTADDAAVATDARRSSAPPSRYCPHSFTSSSHAAETIHSWWWRPWTDEGDESTSSITDDDDDEDEDDNISDESSVSQSGSRALVGDTVSSSGGVSRRGWRDPEGASAI